MTAKPCPYGCLPVGYRCSHYLDAPAAEPVKAAPKCRCSPGYVDTECTSWVAHTLDSGQPAPPQDAEPCNHRRIDPSQPCDVCAPGQPKGSEEPPIDFELADRWAREPVLPITVEWNREVLVNAARAYLSLAATPRQREEEITRLGDLILEAACVTDQYQVCVCGAGRPCAEASAIRARRKESEAKRD